ncbi:ankyrin repeat domain-containing protein [Marinibacterium sp. SX1]|uniref:ankyrin repeat domain-containing protein n=1 Tax=Marinibacterium sp. SX1 TaxID=3388424 RepID=UPI003D180ECB
MPDQSTDSTQHLRREAKALRQAFDRGDAAAVARVQAVLPGAEALRHADALHVIAREAGHDSWPKLKFANEAAALVRAEKSARLAAALFHGRAWAIEALLADTPDLGRDSLALACATYDLAEVRRRLAADPAAATRAEDGRRPIAVLAFSRYHQCGGAEADMLAVADALLAAGADVNDSMPDEHGHGPLPVLYGAIGHGNNMALGEWLLDHGADPNDNESLYHATELGHRGGLRLLLAHGARPEGTNALLRALDFDDAEAVALLLAAKAGAQPDEATSDHAAGSQSPGNPGDETPSSEQGNPVLSNTQSAPPSPSSPQPPLLTAALHHAARRMCSAETVRLLLDHGADPSAVAFGHTAYAMARIHGNAPVAQVIAEAGGDVTLSAAEAQLARAADGPVAQGDWIDMDKLSRESRRLLCRLAGRPGALPQIRRLVEMGFDPNVTDESRLPPLQLAGWEGLPETFAYLLDQKPDLGHVNGFGGTVFGTILHGAENCPDRASRDHLACMSQLLHHGAALPRQALAQANDPALAAFLADWAERHPGQVVDDPT